MIYSILCLQNKYNTFNLCLFVAVCCWSYTQYTYNKTVISGKRSFTTVFWIDSSSVQVSLINIITILIFNRSILSKGVFEISPSICHSTCSNMGDGDTCCTIAVLVYSRTLWKERTTSEQYYHVTRRISWTSGSSALWSFFISRVFSFAVYASQVSKMIGML